MTSRTSLLTVAIAATLALMVSPTYGQLLYSQNFDIDDTANWTAYEETVSPTDVFVDYFFDYSTVGIPSAPNSAGGTTRGMELQANLFSNIFGGFSVSPNGESFTGDYELSYDMWQNYQPVEFVPPFDIFPAGGGIIRGQASGATQLGYGGIMSTNLGHNRAGAADGIFFAATGDGDSGADYRLYSAEQDFSHQWPPTPGTPDEHAVYLAGTRNAADSTLYTDNFGGENPTAAQEALLPTKYVIDPDNITDVGVIGMAWREHTITKIGDDITWAVDGVALITYDISNFGEFDAVPGTSVLGTNILFGHGEINTGSSANPEAVDHLYTLVDNIEVNVATAVVANADFNVDTKVNGADFLLWQQNSGLIGGALLGDGDANGDGNVDDLDLAIWDTQYGTGVLSSGVSAVPEPSTWMLAALAAMVGLLITQPRRAVAVERVH